MQALKLLLLWPVVLAVAVLWPIGVVTGVIDSIAVRKTKRPLIG